MNIFPNFLRAYYWRNIAFLITGAIIFSLSACSSQPTQEILPPTAQATETSQAEVFIPVVEVEATATPVPTEVLPPAPTAIPAAPLEPIGGIELHSISDTGGLSLITKTNAFWIRYNGLYWADVEPNEGERNWNAAEKMEAELQTASELGYEVILIIRNSPTWARTTPSHNCSAIKPDKLDAFVNFVHEAVIRYSAPPYNVKFWELGNEPDVAPEEVDPTMPFGCWGAAQDEYFGGGYYAEMLKTVYPAIKAADPEAQVIVGGLLLGCDPVTPPETSEGSGEYKNCTSAKFLEGILRNGGGDYFDGVSFHAYDYYNGEFPKYSNANWHSSWDTTGTTMIAKAAYLRSLLGIYQYPDKFLMNTETALICGRDGKEPVCQTEEFDQTKANYAAQSFAAALAEGLRANIWFSITGWRGSGLVRSDIQPTYASRGFTFSLEMLENAVYVDRVVEYPGVQGYKFWRNGQNLWVIWGVQNGAQTIELPDIPQAIYDLYGNPLEASQIMGITPSVVYIQFNP
jgi:hypothetical protein